MKSGYVISPKLFIVAVKGGFRTVKWIEQTWGFKWKE